MANKATVTFVQKDFNKTFKNGKSYTGTELSFITENGAKKKEFVFPNARYASVAASLVKGDIIEVTYEKSGDFFNLTNVVFIEKGTAPAPSTSTSGSGYKSGGTGGSYTEAPEKQASIQRQNALTNATSLVVAALEQGVYKKTTSPEIILTEVIRIATQFTAFNSGELQAKTITADTSAIQIDNSDVPFDMDDDVAF